MAWDFPASPTLNQVFEPTPGVIYRWDGSAWLRVPASATGIPEAPANGISYARKDAAWDPIAAVPAGTLPAGVILPYAGAAPPGGFLLCYGQAVSRTTYAALFAALSTTWGGGDGSTTFNLPDFRGRTLAGKDNMGGTAANRLTNTGVGNPGINGAALGAFGGVDRHAVTTTQMPSHGHDGSGTTGYISQDHTHAATTGGENVDHAHLVSGATDSQGAHAHTYQMYHVVAPASVQSGTASRNTSEQWTSTNGAHAHNSYFWSGGRNTGHTHGVNTGGVSANHTHTYSFTVVAAGGSEAHPNVQPTSVVNYIISTGGVA